MYAHELIGKKAIRTKPVQLGNRSIFSFVGSTSAKSGKNEDYSYTASPIQIVNVTNSHLIYRYPDNDPMASMLNTKVHILDSRWLDDAWIDYDLFLAGVEQSAGTEPIVTEEGSLPN